MMCLFQIREWGSLSLACMQAVKLLQASGPPVSKPVALFAELLLSLHFIEQRVYIATSTAEGPHKFGKMEPFQRPSDSYCSHTVDSKQESPSLP